MLEMERVEGAVGWRRIGGELVKKDVAVCGDLRLPKREAEWHDIANPFRVLSYYLIKERLPCRDVTSLSPFFAV